MDDVVVGEGRLFGEPVGLVVVVGEGSLVMGVGLQVLHMVVIGKGRRLNFRDLAVTFSSVGRSRGQAARLGGRLEFRGHAARVGGRPEPWGQAARVGGRPDSWGQGPGVNWGRPGQASGRFYYTVLRVKHEIICMYVF